MKNLGDHILGTGWTTLGAYAAWKGLKGASDSNVGKLIGVVEDVATCGTLGVAKGAPKGVLDALGPLVIVMCT